MPAALFVDLNAIDLNTILVSREQIYARLPHRYEFMQLDGIVHMDPVNRVGVAFREIRDDEWWVRGHIPGRPLFPGILMLESAAQMAAYLSMELYPVKNFLGFSGLDNVKFRSAISPPARMYFILKSVELRPRRIICDAQGVVNGQLVFEARITGMPF